MFVSLFTRAIRYSTVFLFGSTGETLIEKSGHLNLGIPGIMCIGAIGGCTGAQIYMQSCGGNVSVFALILMTILFAMLFAGAIGLLYGVFTITLRCNQNVTGLTITTFGIGLLKYWGIKTQKKGISFLGAADYLAHLFPETWYSGDFGKVFFSYGIYVYLSIAIAIIMAFVLKKTRVGLSLSAIGENPATADAAGINVTKYKYISCILGSGIAGIGGVAYVLDCCIGSLEYVIDAFGWLAVALVIFSMWRPLLGIVGSIVFGFLYILPNSVSASFAQMELVSMIPYLATIIVLIVVSIVGKKETQPPAALGLSYFREER